MSRKHLSSLSHRKRQFDRDDTPITYTLPLPLALSCDLPATLCSLPFVVPDHASDVPAARIRPWPLQVCACKETGTKSRPKEMICIHLPSSPKVRYLVFETAHFRIGPVNRPLHEGDVRITNFT
nr:hypothetical protein CFP56_50874 [Quercus suber]